MICTYYCLADPNVTTDSIAANHNWVISARAVLESRFAFTRDNEPGFANSTTPEANIRQSGSTVLSIGRNFYSPRYTNARTYQWGENLSYVLGRHNIKMGLDMNFQRIGNFFPGNFSGSYTFNSYADFASKKPFSFTQGFAGAGTAGALTTPNVNEYAFFVQDSWRATDRLTLNYGLRYDFFQYAQPAVKNPDPGLAALGLDTSRIPLDNNNIAPRFGLAYKVNQAGTIVARGGYGIYYGRTPSILIGTASNQNGIQVQTYTLNAATGGIPTYPSVLSAPPPLNRTPDIFVFAPNYVQPLTHQWSFNLEFQLARDYGVTLGYLGVRGEHLTQTRDINLFPEVNFRHPGVGGPARPNPAFGRISLFDSNADSIYHGGFIQLTKRLGHGVALQTSYTFSKAIDDAPDFTSVVVGGDDVKNVRDTLRPGLDRGRATADIRHRFVFAGIWDIGYARGLQNGFARALLSGYQLSTISQLQSGRAFTQTAGSDINNDGNTRTDRPLFVGRNTIDGPGFAGVDLRLTRDFSFREKARLRLIFEAFNLTNRANYSTILTTPGPTYLTPTATLDPRILQLAAKFTF